MTEREALKLALEHIEGNYTVSDKETITAIKEVLAQPEPPPECKTEAEKKAFAFGWWKALEANRAQPEQEPVAVYVGETWCGSVVRLYEDLPLETPLYTTPPQTNAYDNMLKAIDSMRPAARVIKDKPATWWLDEFEKVVRNLKEKNT